MSRCYDLRCSDPDMRSVANVRRYEYVRPDRPDMRRADDLRTGIVRSRRSDMPRIYHVSRIHDLRPNGSDLRWFADMRCHTANL